MNNQSSDTQPITIAVIHREVLALRMLTAAVEPVQDMHGVNPMKMFGPTLGETVEKVGQVSMALVSLATEGAAIINTVARLTGEDAGIESNDLFLDEERFAVMIYNAGVRIITEDEQRSIPPAAFLTALGPSVESTLRAMARAAIAYMRERVGCGIEAKDRTEASAIAASLMARRPEVMHA